MNRQIKQRIFWTILLIVTLFTIFGYSSFDDVKPIELTDELGFYQINTCKFSILELQSNNLKTLYQDHYKINVYKYSSIDCFGKVSGIDRVKNDIFISVGFNPLINLLLISVILCFLFNLVGSNKNNKEILNMKFLFGVLSTSIIFLFLILSENRFYEKNLRGLDLTSNKDRLIIFVFLLVSFYFINFHFLQKSESLINYFPYLFIFMGVVNGFNFNIFNVIFVFFYIYSMIKNPSKIKYNLIFITWIIIWLNNINNNNFYLDPDKVVGSSSTIYSKQSTFFWSVVFFYTLFGIFTYIQENYKNLDLMTLNQSFLNSGVSVFILGIITAKLTTINAISFVIFGQNKTSTRDFNYNSLGSWRGFSPSSEHIGEFYGLILLFLLLSRFIYKLNLTYLDYFKIFVIILGLILSNNRAAIAMLVFISLYILFVHVLKFDYRKVILFSLGIIFLGLFLSDQIYPFEFTSTRIYNEANIRTINQESTSLSYFKNSKLDGKMFPITVLGYLSTISFYTNRSSLWGMFLARYNPTGLEFLMGTGPYNLSRLYNEINIQEDPGFLLTHSSLLQILIYQGLVGIILIFYSLFRVYKKQSSVGVSTIFLIPFLYLFINYIKSDSIFYFSSVFTILFFFKLSKHGYKFNE
jgi:hypothetical protein